MAIMFPGPLVTGPPIERLFYSLAFTNLPITTATSKGAMIGVPRFSDGVGTHNIRQIAFRFGTVSKAGGSGIRVSLQDVSTTLQAQPDETQDQYIDIANGDAGFASNLWYTSGNLSADRTVGPEDVIAVVWEWDAAGRQGSDQANISVLSSSFLSGMPFSTYKPSSWSALTNIPNVVLICDDGTIGTLYETMPASALGTISFASNSASDEYANKFTCEQGLVICGVKIPLSLTSGNANFDVVLYGDSTALASASVDGHTLRNTAMQVTSVPFDADVELQSGVTYRLAIKATSTTLLTVNEVTTASANHSDMVYGLLMSGVDKRADEGAWSTHLASGHIPMQPIFCGINAGNGGGLLRHPGMGGGLAG